MVRAALLALALALVAVTGAGCGRDPTPSCVEAAATAVRRSQPTLGALAPSPVELGALGQAVAAACARDGWAREAIACVHGAAVEPALRACRARLTEAQRAALDRDVRAVLGMRP